MSLFTPRRMRGEPSRALIEVLDQLDADHDQAVAQLRKEIAAARSESVRLRESLGKLEKASSDLDTQLNLRVMTALKPVSEFGAALGPYVAQYAGEQRELQDRIATTEALLAQLRSRHAAVAVELRLVTERHGVAIENRPVGGPVLGHGPVEPMSRSSEQMPRSSDEMDRSSEQMPLAAEGG